MLKRACQINLRLDEWELARLRSLIQKSGLSQSAYLRQIIHGVVPKDTPPPDYYAMMRELHGIGRNLNEIAVKAHMLNALDVKRYDEVSRRLEDAIRTIIKAVLLPERRS